MAEMPINTRVFNVRQIGIYRYTDDLHIQREGKGEGKTANRAVTIQMRRPPNPYKGYRRPPDVECIGVEKNAIWPYRPRCPAWPVSCASPRRRCGGGSSPAV